MGQLKQLLPVGSRPMVRQVTKAVCEAGLDQVVVVVGAQADAVSQAVASLTVDTVVNEAWADGMSTSVQAGLRAVRPEIQAVLLVLADQPALTSDMIRTLVARYQATRALIVAPYYQGRRGNPVLFDRALFAELLAVKGDHGGRLLINSHQEQVERVDINDPAVIMDIDTRHDYDRLRGSRDDNEPLD
jgi:molybdenum cofactor cytidylyltransferase